MSDEEDFEPGLIEAAYPAAWNLSCPDWEQRLREGRSLVPTLPLWQDEGDRGVRAFDKLRLADVPGTPLLLDAAGDWFRDIVRALFGSLNRAARRRMIREVFGLVPKKNSKTSYGALLMLTALLLNERPKASFLMTAPVLDTADMAFDQVDGAIALDPVLKKLFHTQSHVKTITHRLTGATLEIVTFDPTVATGRKVSGGALIDELHIVAQMGVKASKVIRQLRGGMMPFPEAFLVFITTQSEEPPAGAMAVELEKARDIRDGKATGVMLPVLYEFPMHMQAVPENGQPAAWLASKNWPMVTPNLGRSISIHALEEGLADARKGGEAEVRAWASQHLNVQIGLALRAKGWNGALYWQACANPKFLSGPEGLLQLLARSEVVTIGIDGGGNDDMLGLCVMGRDEHTGAWLVWVHAWIQRSVLELRKSEAGRFLDFETDGDLTIIDIPGSDIDDVADIVEQVEASELLDRIGVDQAGIQDIVDAIVDRKIPVERIVGIPQGWKLVGAIKTCERRLKSGDIEHAGTRLMDFCLGNALAEPRGNAVIITKQTAGTAKIDPLMAFFDAATLMGMNPKPRKKRFQVIIV